MHKVYRIWKGVGRSHKKEGRTIQVGEGAHEITCSEGGTKYDKMKTASYKLNFFTMTEQFHSTNKATFFCKGKLVNPHSRKLDSELKTGTLPFRD